MTKGDDTYKKVDTEKASEKEKENIVDSKELLGNIRAETLKRGKRDKEVKGR